MATIGQSAGSVPDVNQTTGIGLPVPADFDLDRWSRTLDARGVVYTVRKGRLRWLKNYALLDDFDRSVIRLHRDEIKRRITSKLWPLPPEPEARAAEPEPTQDVPHVPQSQDEEEEPQVFVYGHRVTETDVAECFSRLDQRTQQDRERGWITKREAYRMTAAWLRQSLEMK
ncbi:MAG TPA: hypothetical protein VNT81_14050 [Vicinamibacterales bacterium]|nr:hypothetical protein [Vicinamibacterales bacterium]